MGLFSVHPFVTRKLCFHLLQLFELGSIHANILAIQVIEGRDTDAMFHTEFLDGNPNLLLFQDIDHWVLGKSTSLYVLKFMVMPLLAVAVFRATYKRFQQYTPGSNLESIIKSCMT